jgi:hypothetical protein
MTAPTVPASPIRSRACTVKTFCESFSRLEIKVLPSDQKPPFPNPHGPKLQHPNLHPLTVSRRDSNLRAISPIALPIGRGHRKTEPTNRVATLAPHAVNKKSTDSEMSESVDFLFS